MYVSFDFVTQNLLSSHVCQVCCAVSAKSKSSCFAVCRQKCRYKLWLWAGEGIGSILHFFSLLRESARHQCRHAGHGGRGRVRAPHSNLDWFTGREICVNDEKTLSGGGGMRMIWIRCYPELLSSWSSDLYPTMEAHGPLPSPKVSKQRPVTAFHACGPRNLSEICIRAAESKIIWNILWKHGTF